MKYSPKNLVTLLLTCLWAIGAHSQTQMASLRPGHEVLWHRISPSPEKPGGPVLYEIEFKAGATPGTVPVFAANPQHLSDSPIKISGGNVVIGGGSKLIINGASGLITFATGQTFPAPVFPNLAGEVTGPPGATVVTSAVAGNAANSIVRRDGAGSFAAGSIALNGFLALPNTTSASMGVLALGGQPFLHNFGVLNTFLGTGAGNLTMSGTNNTGVGASALASDTTGSGNSAFGSFALFRNSSDSGNSALGSNNSAFGSGALRSNTSGADNAAFGSDALGSNTTGNLNAAFGSAALLNSTGPENAAFGADALHDTTTGGNNAAFGTGALQQLVSGIGNIAMGEAAGVKLNGSESFDIYIGNAGTAGESNTIRIGNTLNHTAAFIAGINGATSASGVNVFVNSAGQLGTATSSRRFKQQIADLGTESDVLMKLHPVAFYYKPELDSTHTRQYGLVAEEVAQIAPGLVVFDKDGQPETVRYHFVNAMLLNEVQKQRRLIEAQQNKNDEQRSTIARQQVEIEAMQSQLKEVMLRLAAVEKSVPSGTQLASTR